MQLIAEAYDILHAESPVHCIPGEGFEPGTDGFILCKHDDIAAVVRDQDRFPLPGAMLGGLLIGLIETFWSAYFSVEYKDVAAFSILVIVLIFLPTGILGRPEVEKV